MIWNLGTHGWLSGLAETVNRSNPGDTIRVNSQAKKELAERALDRLGKQGVAVEVIQVPEISA